MRAIIVVPLLGLSLLGACSQPQNILSEGPAISPDTSAEGPVHGVVAVHGQGARAPLLDSDNRPVVRRTGLNSDVNNPSGMPARPVTWHEI